MKLKNLIIEAEEELARKVAQYGLTDDEYEEYTTEYNKYLAKNYRVPTDLELNSMCKLQRDRREYVLLGEADSIQSRDGTI